MIVGRVSGLYGVKGWVKVFSYTEPADALLGYPQWLLGQGGQWTARALLEGRKHGKALVAHLDGTDDRDTAAGLVGADIGVARESLPAAAEGEYYWADLEGAAVRHRDGSLLGRVVRMLATGANDVMVVQSARDAEREILIPFVPEVYILKVDVAEGVIDVDWEWD